MPISGSGGTKLPVARTLNNAQSPVATVDMGAIIRGRNANDSNWYTAEVYDGSGDSLSPFTNALMVNGRSFLYDATTNDWERERAITVFKPIDLVAGTTETTIWTPAASRKFRLMGFILTCAAASTLTFKDNTAGTTIFVARGGIDIPIQVDLGSGILSGAANRVLTVTRGTSTALSGTLWGTEEA